MRSLQFDSLNFFLYNLLLQIIIVLKTLHSVCMVLILYVKHQNDDYIQPL